MKRLALLAILFTVFILSLPAPAVAAGPGTGTIDGQLVNGTAGGSSVANLELTLETTLSSGEVISTTANADAEGRFAFDGLATDPGNSYQVTATFQHVDYATDPITFNPGETSRSAELTVYDTTSSVDVVSVPVAHTVIYVGQGSLEIRVYVVIANSSDRTYIGSQVIDPASNAKAVTEFSLPSGATGLQAGSGLTDSAIHPNPEGFAESTPLLPGTKEVVYSYQVADPSGEYSFPEKIYYPTAKYNLLVQGDVQVTSSQLTMQAPLTMGDAKFTYLSGTNLSPGTMLEVQLSGLPRTEGSGLQWAALALVLLIIGASLTYLMRRRKPQPGPARDSAGADQTEEDLLVEISRLDDAFEDGKMDEESYRRLRAEKKACLMELMQGMKQSGHR
ncbi:MAG: carboxypeptidase-like regulatory domain-containing protein [Chloroflexota bacterium]